MMNTSKVETITRVDSDFFISLSSFLFRFRRVSNYLSSRPLRECFLRAGAASLLFDVPPAPPLSLRSESIRPPQKLVLQAHPRLINLLLLRKAVVVVLMLTMLISCSIWNLHVYQRRRLDAPFLFSSNHSKSLSAQKVDFSSLVTCVCLGR